MDLHNDIILISINQGLIVILKGDTTLPWWSYIVALTTGGKSNHCILLICSNFILSRHLIAFVAVG